MVIPVVFFFLIKKYINEKTNKKIYYLKMSVTQIFCTIENWRKHQSPSELYKPLLYNTKFQSSLLLWNNFNYNLFLQLSLTSDKTKKKKIESILEWIHLGPESSIAWTSNEESSVRSEYLSDAENSWGLHLVDSTLWEASHLSARPSPSSIRTTSDILGLWPGRYWVHKSATCTISSSSIRS